MIADWIENWMGRRLQRDDGQVIAEALRRGQEARNTFANPAIREAFQDEFNDLLDEMLSSTDDDRVLRIHSEIQTMARVQARLQSLIHQESEINASGSTE